MPISKEILENPDRYAVIPKTYVKKLQDWTKKVIKYFQTSKETQQAKKEIDAIRKANRETHEPGFFSKNDENANKWRNLLTFGTHVWEKYGQVVVTPARCKNILTNWQNNRHGDLRVAGNFNHNHLGGTSGFIKDMRIVPDIGLQIKLDYTEEGYKKAFPQGKYPAEFPGISAELDLVPGENGKPIEACIGFALTPNPYVSGTGEFYDSTPPPSLSDKLITFLTQKKTLTLTSESTIKMAWNYMKGENMELEQIKELLEFSKSLSDSDRKIAGNLLLNNNQEQTQQAPQAPQAPQGQDFSKLETMLSGFVEKIGTMLTKDAGKTTESGENKDSTWDTKAGTWLATSIPDAAARLLQEENAMKLRNARKYLDGMMQEGKLLNLDKKAQDGFIDMYMDDPDKTEHLMSHFLGRKESYGVSMVNPMATSDYEKELSKITGALSEDEKKLIRIGG
jgi:hypothetical protein